jgi:hypothetical protein
MVLVGCCMLGAGWVAPRWPWDDGGRHGREVLLAAQFGSVLCVVLRGRHRLVTENRRISNINDKML